ncbi:SDR family oxidoreductase [Candidatus Neomarinimicrobiota bacterium]
MNVALFGGTGFIGSYLVEELLDRDHRPHLLVRPGSEKKVIRAEECNLIMGDLDDVKAIHASLDACDAAVYCVGIIREDRRTGKTFHKVQYENAKAVVDAAVEMGVPRFILMSANGVRPDGTSYQRSKYMAEEYLKTTGLQWTIFRPSVIFGDPRGKMEFCTQLRDELIKLPLPVPLFYQGLLPTGAGRFLLSPVHVRDVASIFVKSLELAVTVGQTFDLGGKDTVDWKTAVMTIAQASGRHKWTLPVPAAAFYLIAALLDRFTFFPVTREQLSMLLEGNVADSQEVFRIFNIDPIPFDTNSLKYLREFVN